MDSIKNGWNAAVAWTKNAGLWIKAKSTQTVDAIDAKTNPKFGAEMHRWSRRLSRIFLWAILPLTIVILVGCLAAASYDPTLDNWSLVSGGAYIATVTTAVVGSVTVFLHLLWFWFSKYQYVEKK